MKGNGSCVILPRISIWQEKYFLPTKESAFRTDQKKISWKNIHLANQNETTTNEDVVDFKGKYMGPSLYSYPFTYKYLNYFFSIPLLI